MAVELVEYEVKLLRHLNGEQVEGLLWGAAMGEALEALKSSWLIHFDGQMYSITEKGKKHLEQLDG